MLWLVQRRSLRKSRLQESLTLEGTLTLGKCLLQRRRVFRCLPPAPTLSKAGHGHAGTCDTKAAYRSVDENLVEKLMDTDDNDKNKADHYCVIEPSDLLKAIRRELNQDGKVV